MLCLISYGLYRLLRGQRNPEIRLYQTHRRSLFLDEQALLHKWLIEHKIYLYRILLHTNQCDGSEQSRLGLLRIGVQSPVPGRGSFCSLNIAISFPVK